MKFAVFASYAHEGFFEDIFDDFESAKALYDKITLHHAGSAYGECAIDKRLVVILSMEDS